MGQLLGYEPFAVEGKLAYIKLNTPMPCPPRGTVPDNTRAWFCEFISTQHAQFAFGQGCDCPSYVAERMRQGM